MGMIMRLSIERLQLAARLFREFPYKRVQQRVQGIDPERMLPFYLNGLKTSMSEGNPHWIALDQTTPVAAAGLVHDKWHSGVYGTRMGKIQPFLNTINRKAGEPMLAGVVSLAVQQGFGHLSARLDGEDYPNLQLFERALFRMVDVSMKFSLPMPLAARRFATQPAQNKEEAAWKIRLASPNDKEWMGRLGAINHGGSHFFNDPALPREKTVLLFRKWVERCLDGLAWRTYVLFREGEEPKGFVIYLRNKSFAEASGRTPIILDFVLLHPSLRGKGLGPWFIEETLADAGNAKGEGEQFDFCELRTSTHNLQAVNCYEKLGFLTVATDFVLHRKM